MMVYTGSVFIVIRTVSSVELRSRSTATTLVPSWANHNAVKIFVTKLPYVYLCRYILRSNINATIGSKIIHIQYEKEKVILDFNDYSVKFEMLQWFIEPQRPRRTQSIILSFFSLWSLCTLWLKRRLLHPNRNDFVFLIKELYYLVIYLLQI